MWAIVIRGPIAPLLQKPTTEPRNWGNSQELSNGKKFLLCQCQAPYFFGFSSPNSSGFVSPSPNSRGFPSSSPYSLGISSSALNFRGCSSPASYSRGISSSAPFLLGFSSPAPNSREFSMSCCLPCSMSSSRDGGEQVAGESAEARKERRILASSLYIHVSPDKEPLVYSSAYNIGFMGLEKLHPFDSAKWGRIRDFLVNEDIIDASSIVEPAEATKEDLLVVHTEDYLQSLTSSFNVAAIIEVPPVALLPNSIVKRQVLRPFKKQVGGTVLAGKLAKEKGWAINLGGGFHHCCGYRGGGFCVYADITLCIQFAFSQLSISKVMIIDLDAHQGNGHERDFVNDERVYIFDMYNRDIYPYDSEAKRGINQRIEIRSGTSTDEYLQRLDAELKIAKQAFQPDYIMYNAGTDVLDGDPLGRLCVSPDGVTRRDEMVFRFAKELRAPIVMVTSGGYMKTSARVIADSIINLNSKSLITLRSGLLQPVQ